MLHYFPVDKEKDLNLVLGKIAICVFVVELN